MVIRNICNTVDIRYFEYSLSQTFIISNFFFGPSALLVTTLINSFDISNPLSQTFTKSNYFIGSFSAFQCYFPCAIFFFCLGFLPQLFTIHRIACKRGGYLFNSSPPLSLVSQTLRHYTGNYCRELTSVHSQESELNREPLVSGRKSLTTKLHALFLEENKNT